MTSKVFMVDSNDNFDNVDSYFFNLSMHPLGVERPLTYTTTEWNPKICAKKKRNGTRLI